MPLIVNVVPEKEAFTPLGNPEADPDVAPARVYVISDIAVLMQTVWASLPPRVHCPATLKLSDSNRIIIKKPIRFIPIILQKLSPSLPVI